MGQEFSNAEKEFKESTQYIFHGNHYYLRKPSMKIITKQNMRSYMDNCSYQEKLLDF